MFVIWSTLFRKIEKRGAGGVQPVPLPAEPAENHQEEGEEEDGEPAPKRRKKVMTEFDKIDGITKWSNDVSDLRKDADKVQEECALHVARWQASVSSVDQILAKGLTKNSELASSDMYKDLIQEVDLTKGLALYTNVIAKTLALCSVSSHMNMTDVDDEESKLQEYLLRALPLQETLPDTAKAMLEKVQ